MTRSLRVVQVVIISLWSNRSIRGVGWVIVLPIDVHETGKDMNYTIRCVYWESYLVTSEDWPRWNADDVNTLWRPNWVPMLVMIGIAS